MKYEYATLLCHESDEWNAMVPDLPGCYSCGDTIEEARAGIQEAIELWVEVALENGEALPEP
jgi:predicted RNase H-like HicB family nuclease